MNEKEHANMALQDWLRDRDAPCPMCKYNLRSLEGETCPECGVGIELGLRVPGFLLGWWVLAIVAFATDVGFAGLMLCGFVIADVMYPPPSFEPLAVLGASMALGVLAIVVLWKKRAAIAMRPWRIQRFLGVLGLVLGLGMGLGTLAYLFWMDF